MSDLVFACRPRLIWKRDGSAWVLWCARPRIGRGVPDAEQPGGMYPLGQGRAAVSASSPTWTTSAVTADAI